MKKFAGLILIFILVSPTFAQKAEEFLSKLNQSTEKGDYAILEVRLNNEDEFSTIEGSNSSLARIALFTGKNKGKEVISKQFDGVNSIVRTLNKLKHMGWKIIEVYPIKGKSLIITHYVLERKK